MASAPHYEKVAVLGLSLWVIMGAGFSWLPEAICGAPDKFYIDISFGF